MLVLLVVQTELPRRLLLPVLGPSVGGSHARWRATDTVGVASARDEDVPVGEQSRAHSLCLSRAL